MPVTAHEIHLKSRPSGMPGPENFEFVERRLADPADGQLLVRTLWMSVDPYMRGRMTDRPSYIAPFQLGQPLEGAAVGVVEQSRDARFKPGDVVTHFAGWRDYAVIDAKTARGIEPSSIPLEAWLGALGVPGETAHAGLLHFAKLRKGETVFVSAAAGAVGSMAVQIAKLKGARVIGSVGSEEKARWVKEDLGADAVINYKTAGNLTEALASAAPEGIDVYFDNVGGSHLEAAIDATRLYARLIICGMIARYNDETPSPGPRNLAMFIGKRLTMQGFIILDHADLRPNFIREMSGWIAQGQIKTRDTVVEGLENAPKAFLGLFSGENIGKMLVKIGER
ncbi:NADP-dependent oxidoreductase [Mesorhizobium sp. BAC0120]|uniref:NADP-dependent oxidoreductase n=1 Tax=Mesorhizobium sp. BAC0120 TaxID=3090670 RepID=UPI00298C311A|nr:NADP-dependent oxidoreductase [Mesorhizobium sp. BAC0120]MDW6022405.1 NADP-dependent oxidoreductase [Mesorhizobium sp. BAC0120]